MSGLSVHQNEEKITLKATELVYPDHDTCYLKIQIGLDYIDIYFRNRTECELFCAEHNIRVHVTHAEAD